MPVVGFSPNVFFSVTAKSGESAVNIPHTDSCQQSILITNNLACNSLDRIIAAQVSLFATLIKSEKNGTPFNRQWWIDFYNRENPEKTTSVSTTYRAIQRFKELGLIEEINCHTFRITERGNIVAQSFLKTLTLFARWTKIGQKKAIEEYFLAYEKTQLNGQLNGQLTGFETCSYIEETNKRRMVNISTCQPGQYEKSLSLNTNERMFSDIKRRNPGIEDQNLELVFSLVRGTVGVIKKDLWMDEFDKCVKAGLALYAKFKETFHDREETFKKSWFSSGRRGWFNSADKLTATMNYQYEKRAPKELEKYTQEQWEEKINPNYFKDYPREVLA